MEFKLSTEIIMNTLIVTNKKHDIHMMVLDIVILRAKMIDQSKDLLCDKAKGMKH